MNLSDLSALALVLGTSSIASAPPVMAQAPVPASQIRALNLARNTAVAENGGLSVYRPQPCMFKTSDGGGECLVSDDASVSTIGSMASRAKNFIVSKTSGTISGGSGSPNKTGSPSRSISASKQDDVSDIASTTTGKTFGSIKKKLGSIKKSMKSSPSSTPRVPGSIGGPFFSPSPLKEEPIREDGVEYSAVPPPILSDGTADITPDHSDRELDLSTSAYVDENDNDGSKGKKDECCSQGCIIL